MAIASCWLPGTASPTILLNKNYRPKKKIAAGGGWLCNRHGRPRPCPGPGLCARGCRRRARALWARLLQLRLDAGDAAPAACRARRLPARAGAPWARRLARARAARHASATAVSNLVGLRTRVSIACLTLPLMGKGKVPCLVSKQAVLVCYRKPLTSTTADQHFALRSLHDPRRRSALLSPMPAARYARCQHAGCKRNTTALCSTWSG